MKAYTAAADNLMDQPKVGTLKLLSIVTVVRNDLPGLMATIQSTSPIRDNRVERIVIDGSDDSKIKNHLKQVADQFAINWVSESDRGIYDAMNKGLRLSKGRYALFLNAGDTLRAEFVENFPRLVNRFENESCVMIGHAVESYGKHQWLHPGIGQESSVFTSPQHQATFYPNEFYRENAYRVDRPISADGEYTVLALDTMGGAYFPVVVSEFELGGVSSNYSSFKRLRKRLSEHRDDRHMKIKLRLKFLMWWMMPRVFFYTILAVAAKYTKVRAGEHVLIADQDLRQPAKPVVSPLGATSVSTNEIK